MECTKFFRKLKSFVAILFVLVLVFSLVMIPSASAYTAYPYKLQDGIRNRYCYFDSSVSGFWSTAYYNGINAWYNTPTYFSFTPTTTWSSSTIDFFTESVSATYGGYCDYFLTGGGKPNPYAQNWKYCEIVLNKGSNALGAYGIDLVSGVVCHELGHATGLLDDYSNWSVVMCGYYNVMRALLPMQDDINGVNAKYPNGY